MRQPPEHAAPSATAAPTSGGYCRRCGREHRLGPGNTLGACRELMRLLAERGTIDLLDTEPGAKAELATAWLFGPARGKMFGVLECLRPDGTTTYLRAFSGQYQGRWLVDGWAPPLFPVGDFTALSAEVEMRIKELGRQLEGCPPHSAGWLAMRCERRQLSRQLMRDIHGLYRLRNFRGETVALAEAFASPRGEAKISTGTGDCCGPKLLNAAAQQGLRPVGLAEFYWGRENRSGSRHHHQFSGSCSEKCGPILGFMLCGLDDDNGGRR